MIMLNSMLHTHPPPSAPGMDMGTACEQGSKLKTVYCNNYYYTRFYLKQKKNMSIQTECQPKRKLLKHLPRWAGFMSLGFSGATDTISCAITIR